MWYKFIASFIVLFIWEYDPRFKKKSAIVVPVVLHNIQTEFVQECKYLGTTTNDKLTWDANTAAKFAKAQRRLCFK